MSEGIYMTIEKRLIIGRQDSDQIYCSTTAAEIPNII